MTAFTPAMSPSLNRSLTSFPRPLTSLLGEEGLVTLHPRRLVHYASLSIPAMSRRGTDPALQPGQGRRTGGERHQGKIKPAGDRLGRVDGLAPARPHDDVHVVGAADVSHPRDLG